MAEENRCPQCGADLPADAPHGLCPKCLMKMGLEGDAKATIDDPGDIESPGTRIGRYKLLQLIGEGGMGLVYLAEQQEPVRRRVALKVVKPGMDSKQVIARFEAERQALALLDHPNIAHVFDAGTTESGRPYFVMEYVKGLSLIEHCDREKLSIEERLEIFLQVCEAIQHAHQKGIIHRDIKPSNVLVSKEDEKALPKIIDFGVAKALTQPLTERTLFTVQGQLIGTPEYMSPEQVDMAIQDIDIRSDIYSLGVLLYELLAGALPFERKDLEQAGLAEIQRIIREQEPPRPSTRLSSLGKEAESIAESRRTKVAMLAKRLHKELEWIPLKAMRKERARRYRTASELADDVQNYLNGAPLIAGPESVAYRAKKFVRRNRALVTGIAAVLVVLAAGVVVSTIFAIGQARARDEAVAARDEAERQAKVSRAVVDFLTYDVLGKAKGKQSVPDLLDAASENLEDRFKEVPLAEASVRKALGVTYRSLGKYEAAEPHLKRALEIRREQLGEDHWDTLVSMGDLVSVYLYRGQKDEGKVLKGDSLFNKALKLGERKWKDDMRKWADDMRDILDEYTWWKIIVSVIRSTLYGEEDMVVEVNARLRFENFMIPSNKFLNLLAETFTGLGQYKKAEELLLDIVDDCLDWFGEEHPSTVESINNLIDLYEAWGKPEKAKEWRAKLPGKWRAKLLLVKARASRPQPVDGVVVGVVTSLELSWVPGIDATAHKVYFGTKKDQLALLEEVATANYAKLPALEKDTVYYWRIDEVKADGSVATGNVWSFTTGGKLVGWWKFDEGSDTEANDSSGNGYDGTLNDMDDSDWVDGVISGALEFDGVDDYVSIPALNLYTDSLTISAWIKRDGVQQARDTGIVFSRDGSTSAGICFGHGQGWTINHHLAYNWNDDMAAWAWDSELFVPNNQWVFVALVIEPTKATLYLSENETLSSATNRINHGIEEFDGVTRIGHDVVTEGRYFKGCIDDVRIYNYPLSQAEVAAIYAGKEPESTGD